MEFPIENEKIFHLFPHLPIELRRKIWHETLTPRTLTLNFHLQNNFTTCKIPQALPHKFYSLRATIASFTAREGLHPHPFTINERDKGSDYADLDRFPSSLSEGFTFRSKEFLSEKQRQKSTTGPIILEVCSESRSVALESYERAFGGSMVFKGLQKDQEFCDAFDKSGIAEPKIWIDFKRDTLLLVGADGDGGRYDINEQGLSSWVGGLAQFVKYAKEEVKKVRKVVIAGVWFGDEDPNEMENIDDRVWLADQMVWSAIREGEGLEKALVRYLPEFTTLDFLGIYPSYDFRVVKPYLEYELRKCTQVDGWRYGDRDVQLMRERIVGYLETEKTKQGDKWATNLPAVTVSTDVQWRMEKHVQGGLRHIPVMRFDTSNIELGFHRGPWA